MFKSQSQLWSMWTTDFSKVRQKSCIINKFIYNNIKPLLSKTKYTIKIMKYHIFENYFILSFQLNDIFSYVWYDFKFSYHMCTKNLFYLIEVFYNKCRGIWIVCVENIWLFYFMKDIHFQHNWQYSSRSYQQKCPDMCWKRKYRVHYNFVEKSFWVFHFHK